MSVIRRYEYDDVPTILSFAKDDESFIKALMGPFGSGKSSGCAVEIARRAKAQKPDAQGVRRTRWAVVRNCFDDKTEILTEKRGWKLFRDLLEIDKVASVQNGALVYVRPNEYYVYPYKGEMIGCKMENLDFLVTPEHNLYVSRINGRNKKRSPYCFRKADEVYGKTNVEFETTVSWKDKRGEIFGELFYEFLGFWFAEGSAGVYKYGNKEVKRWTITQKKYIEYAKSLLDANSLKYSINKRKDGTVVFSLVPLQLSNIHSELVASGESKNRTIPRWIRTASADYLKAFLHGFIMGDGHFKDGPHDSTRLWTTSKAMADDLQEIALKAGYSSSLKKNSQWVLTIYTEGKKHPQPRNNNKKSPWYKQSYDGNVYCLSVPSHIIVTRRNGVISVTSQSYPQLRDTSIKTFHYWFPPEKCGTWRATDHDYRMRWILSDGTRVFAEVLFRALDRPEHVKNLLSLELTGAWINEAREIAKPIIDAVQGRVGRFPAVQDEGCTWAGIIMDTNPPDTDSWWYKLFEEERPPNCKIYKQPSGRGEKAENLKNLPKNYYSNLMIGKDPEFIKVYIDGEYGYVQEGRPVFPNFRDSLHVSEHDLKAIMGVPLILGWDFGLTPCCVIGQLSPRGCLNILHEFMSENMGIRSLARTVVKPFLLTNYRRWVEMNHIVSVGDWAGNARAETDEKTCFMELRDAGIPSIMARTNNITARIQAVDVFLTRLVDGKAGFQLSPSCKMLRKGFNGAYRFKRIQVIGEDRFQNAPEKNIYSHSQDALQYLALSADQDIQTAERNVRVKETHSNIVTGNFVNFGGHV